MDKLYFDRLKKFAVALEHMQVSNDLDVREAWIEGTYDDLEMFFTCFYMPKIYDVLIELFPMDWFFDEAFCDQPSVIWHPDYGLPHSVMRFFDLNVFEFVHLFDTSTKGQKTERWSGKILSESSTPKDFAHNIFEFLNAKK